MCAQMPASKLVQLGLVEAAFIPHLVNSLLRPFREKERDSQLECRQILLGIYIGGSVQKL